ncbi:MAG: 23S rRNA (adenine(2503)-C(2))-methyltransferase RlmN [Planctomycetes bacterium]|nr:23S rRNA (adenine(2503)-C(2))-methyltransferase RlmN [Planctomycetota bacterium]
METLAGLTVQEFEELCAADDLERWRARPILQWIHRRGATSFEGMTDLSKETRAALAAKHRIFSTTVRERRASPDGTTKLLIGLEDGDVVETVLIPEADRRTICISTQVGCPVRCRFCASGLNGLRRNLGAAEIAEQVLHVKRELEPHLTSVVVMGIGEPLLNYANLTKALRIMKASWGMGIGYNRITLSTVGVLDKIDRLVEDGVTPNLAISLHAPNDEIRREIVPTMAKVRVIDLIKAGRAYKEATRKNVTFEYVLLDGVNDDRKHALELGKKVRGTKMKVNVIPYNRVEETGFRAPSKERLDRFVEALGGCGVPIMVRKQKGDEVSAACGQLRARWTEPVPTEHA